MMESEFSIQNQSQEISQEGENFETLNKQFNQKINQNDIQEAYDIFEQNLNLYINTYGYNQPTIIFANETMQNLSNKCILQFERGKKINAISCLERLGKLSERFSCQWKILNDLSCCYRNIDENKKAYKSLEQVLRIPGLDQQKLAATHLNICAILSQIQKHKRAREHALYALKLLKELQVNNEDDQNVISTLSIAYYNLGVEEEFLNQLESAVYWYRETYNILKQYVPQSPLISDIQKLL